MLLTNVIKTHSGFLFYVFLYVAVQHIRAKKKNKKELDNTKK